MLQNSRLNPNFFIVGTQRSGTTLLRLIMNNHPLIAIPTESTHFMPFLTHGQVDSQQLLSEKRKKTIASYLEGNSQFTKWKIPAQQFKNCFEGDLTMKQLISNLYQCFATMHGKKLCGDKSPTFIRKLKVLADSFPNAKFIHIVRDGRDTFLSLRKMKAGGNASPALNAYEWSVKMSLIHRTLDLIPERTFTVRYEDLVVTPEDIVPKICNFIGLEYDSSMLNFWRSSEKNIAKHHSKLIFKPIDAANIEKWRKDLNKNDNLEYTFFAQKMLVRHGYDIPVKDVASLFNKVCWWKDFLLLIPVRLFRIIRIALVMRIAAKYGFKVASKYYD